MSMLDSQLASDIAFTMADLNAVPGSEPVVYRPLHGDPVNINAVVKRLPPMQSPESGQMVHHIEIWVANNATYGVTSVNKEGDSVSVARQRGGTAQDLRVADILFGDAAGWTLLLE